MCDVLCTLHAGPRAASTCCESNSNRVREGASASTLDLGLPGGWDVTARVVEAELQTNAWCSQRNH